MDLRAVLPRRRDCVSICPPQCGTEPDSGELVPVLHNKVRTSVSLIGDISDVDGSIATPLGQPRTMTSLSLNSQMRLTRDSATYVSGGYTVSSLMLHPQAISPNLTAFVGAESGKNGKIMHYVGWADELISPGNSLHYYETVDAFMTSNTELDTDDFYRLYTVPGMNHW